MPCVRQFPLVLLLGFLALQGGCAHHTSSSRYRSAVAPSARVAGISDFGKVNDFLYRGSQPNREGMKALREIGIDTIVDLRGERRGTGLKEAGHAQSLGMRFVNIPGTGWSPPTDEQMGEFFSLFREVPRRKVYVHCWLGTDRSGVFIAAYRIAFEGWTPDQALDEMNQYHFKGFWHPAMKAYIRDFPARLQRSVVLGSFRPLPASN
jgi:tyrosine-protein phosphatase SIW14